MKAKINLITIWADDVPSMVYFYREVMGFEVITDLGQYVEFRNEGVRFSICGRPVMAEIHDSYHEKQKGQAFELAFPCDTPEGVDRTYEEIIGKGATPIQGPADMPWNQRTAFFADPEGNIHELFAELNIEV
jgi:catechol 2,3-dioxygenase-like lactoylglutathione lyase family enzyme